MITTLCNNDVWCLFGYKDQCHFFHVNSVEKHELGNLANVYDKPRIAAQYLSPLYHTIYGAYLNSYWLS